MGCSSASISYVKKLHFLAPGRQQHPSDLTFPLSFPAPLHFRMFLSTPNELQHLIFSFCDVPTLASLLLVSHHTHTLAIEPLYHTVTLTTWSHLRAFFSFPSAAAQPSSTLAADLAARRRAELHRIKHLVLLFLDWWLPVSGADAPRHAPLPSLPSFPISSRLLLTAQPLRLESLQITNTQSLRAVANLLRCVNPRVFGSFSLTIPRASFRPPTLNDEFDFDLYSSLWSKRWDRLESWSYGSQGGYSGGAVRNEHEVMSSPFRVRGGRLENATVWLPDRNPVWPPIFPGHPRSPEGVLARFLKFCPTLGTLTVLVREVEDVKKVKGHLKTASGGGKMKWERVEVRVGELVRVEGEGRGGWLEEGEREWERDD